MTVWIELDKTGFLAWLNGLDLEKTVLLLFVVSAAWGVVAYLTRDLGPKQRGVFKRNLRNLRSRLALFESQLQKAKLDSDVVGIDEEFSRFWQESAGWVRDNMGLSAQAKLVSGNPAAAHYDWEGEHKVRVQERRSTLLAVISYRSQIVDELLTCDAWDDPPPAKFFERVKWWD